MLNARQSRVSVLALSFAGNRAGTRGRTRLSSISAASTTRRVVASSRRRVVAHLLGHTHAAHAKHIWVGGSADVDVRYAAVLVAKAASHCVSTMYLLQYILTIVRILYYVTCTSRRSLW